MKHFSREHLPRNSVFLFLLSMHPFTPLYADIKQRCLEGDLASCYRFALDLRERGEEGKASKILEQVCAEGYGKACRVPPHRRMEPASPPPPSPGIPRHADIPSPKAKELSHLREWIDSCRNGDVLGFVSAAAAYAGTDDELVFMDQACRLKDANSCAYLGLYYKHEKPVNPEKSNYYYRQACRFGDKSACQELMK